MAENKQELTFQDFVVHYTGFPKPDQNLLYVGVGTAANIDHKNGAVLDMNNYHQFPPVVRSIYQKHNMTTHLVQIDPFTSDIPYVVKDDGTPNFYQDDQYSNVWHSYDNSLHVYSFRIYAEYGLQGPVKNDIIDYLRTLNNFTVESNHLMLFHDFTGRNTFEVAYYFDRELKDNIDRVVYDITCRCPGTCYVELTNPAMIYNTNLRRNGIVVIANPYSIPKEEWITTFVDNMGNQHIQAQMAAVIHNEINRLFEYIFPIYRRFMMSLQKLEEEQNIEPLLRTIQTTNDVNFLYPDFIFDYALLEQYKILVYTVQQAEHENLVAQCSQFVGACKMILHDYIMRIYSMFRLNTNKVVNELIDQIPNEPYKWTATIRDSIRNHINGIVGEGIDMPRMVQRFL
jgi:hypothetical protein